MGNKDNTEQIRIQFLEQTPLPNSVKVICKMMDWTRNHGTPNIVIVNPVMFDRLRHEWSLDMEHIATIKPGWKIAGVKLITSDMVGVDEILIF